MTIYADIAFCFCDHYTYTGCYKRRSHTRSALTVSVIRFFIIINICVTLVTTFIYSGVLTDHTSTMSGSYTIGGVSGLLSSKKKKKKSELDTLFSSASPYRPVFTASIPTTADEVKIKTPPKPVKKKKRKSEPSPQASEGESVNPKKKKLTKKREALAVNGKEGVKDENRVSSGFCPPPGIVHESLMADTKNKKTRVEEREEALADSATSSKKKRKRSQEEDDEEEEGQVVAPKKKIKIKWEKDPTVDAKTIFVGNLPVNYDTKAVRRLFRKYGKIQSVRLRSATPANLTLPKKVAVIKQEFHPDRKSINAYVVFSEEEETKKALKKNGRLIDGHHIKVDLVGQENEHDHKKSIFVGNLPFAILDDELWECFEEIGNIRSVRVVRDSKTGMGKGFGYVHFKDTTSVDLALKLNGKKYKERNIRVTRSRAENKLQKEISLTSEKRPTGKRKKKFSKPSNAAAGSFQGQKALTDDEVRKLRKKKKMARSGVHGKGKKANVLNAMLRLKKRQGGGEKSGAVSATPPKGGKKDKKGLGSGKKNKMGHGHGKKNKMGLGKGKKNKTGLGTSGKGIKKGLGIGKKKKIKHGKK